jgi:hypothetical protein
MSPAERRRRRVLPRGEGSGSGEGRLTRWERCLVSGRPRPLSSSAILRVEQTEDTWNIRSDGALLAAPCTAAAGLSMGAGERSEAYRKRPAACARTPRAYTQPSRAPAHKLEIPPAAGQIQSAPGRHREVRRSCPLQRKATSFSPAWMERVWTVDIHCVPEQLAKTHLSRSSMLIARRMEGRWEPAAAQSADFGSYLPSSSS